MRTNFYRDPNGIFLHDAVLESCRAFAQREAIIDTGANVRLSYARLGELIEAAARGFVRAGLRPGEIVAIFLANSWEYVVAAHAVTLAGGIPTLLNPSYKEREARYQLENSGAVMLITDAAQLSGVSFTGLPLRHVYHISDSSNLRCTGPTVSGKPWHRRIVGSCAKMAAIAGSAKPASW